ncbi:hypothetical protein [Pantoea sp. R13S299]|uniref:hypothetical protein n=1 Tax=Pantoea sp. R13S299 TaxID=3402751 RepID=UPI003ADEA3EA
MKMVLPVDGYHSAAAFMAAMQGSRGDTYWLMKQAEHWHGGIHLYDGFAGNAVCKPGSSGLKSMTDGHVVAWRLNDDYQTAASGKKRLKFSSTFLLIKSTCIPDSDRPDNGLDFYTLWMQIAPLSEYGVTGVRTATVTAGTLKIRQDNTFPGWVRGGLSEGISVPRDVLRHYEVPQDTHTTLPRGTVVEVKQEATFLLKGRPAPFIFVSVVSVPEGAKSGLSAGESGWISGLARFVKRQEDTLPAWMQAARKHGVFNQVVTVSGENAPVVKAGEVIGHLGLCERPHGAPEHFCHLEVFSQDARMKSFLANAAGVTTGMTELHTLAGRTRWMYREKEKTFVVAGVDGDPSMSTAERYTQEGECRRMEADGKSWYHIPGELAWMAAEDVEKVNQFELEKRGFMPLEQEEEAQSIFQTPKEGWLREVFGRLEALARGETRDMYSASYTERYRLLVKQMDANRDGVIDAGELWRFLHNSQRHIRYQVERLVVKHHSEWLKDGMSALWQAALDEQAKKHPDMALYNRDFINALVWMKEVPEIRSGEALWHMHPIVFLDAIAVSSGRITLAMLRMIWTLTASVSDEALQQVADELNANLELCNLNTEQRLYHFMAQVYQETGSEFSITENLNYASTALPVFFSYYRLHPTEQILDGRTEKHIANQINIANKAYGSRNGNNMQGDGWLYRGRGMKQLTGKDNYKRFTEYNTRKWNEVVDFVNNPEMVADNIKYAVRSALFFWDDGKMYLKADGGYSLNASVEVTNIINSGLSMSEKNKRFNNMEDFLKKKIFHGVFD